MVSRVTYRPFDEDDFNTLATILQGLWHTHVPSPGYGFLEGCADLAHYLSISTFSQVVLIDDQPSGIVLARSDNDRHASGNKHWQEAYADYLHQMELADEKAAKSYGCTIDAMDRTNARLLEKSGFSIDNEVTLLAVAPEARGLGLGTVLLDAATTYLASHGANRAFIYTDTDCSWQFYERRGLKRAASHRANREERKYIPKEMYVYGLDLSA